MSAPQHNLDIYSYSLEELFQLLNLPPNPVKEDMNRAKKKVLMFHPDKSRLSPEYFLFYKKAYEIALKYYQERNKQNREITEENTTYTSNMDSGNSDLNKTLKKNIEQLSQGDAKKQGKFNDKFNQIFERNMVEKRENLNGWFAEETPVYQDIPTQSKSTAALSSEAFDRIKDKNQAMIVHQGVRDFSYSAGGKFFDTQEEDENEYISSDPFGKLKFDDLRKVHKDQTVFAVKESDFNNVAKYSSVDQYQKAREGPVVPLDKKQAEIYLENREKQMNAQHQQRMHQATLKTMKYEETNKKIQGAFLRLN